MDVRLFIAVMRRFRWMVISILVATTLLAVAAYGHPAYSHGKLTFVRRGMDTWTSNAQVLITQAGDPYGRAVQQYEPGSKNTPSAIVGDYSYLESLAPIYAALANGDTIQNQVLGTGKHKIQDSTVIATEDVDPNTGLYLPFVDIAATAPYKQLASSLARHETTALQQAVVAQQNATDIPAEKRVVLNVVMSGAKPTLTAAPKLTKPLLVLLAGIAGAIMLAFVRENMRPESAERLGRLGPSVPNLPVRDVRVHPWLNSGAEPPQVPAPAHADENHILTPSGNGAKEDSQPASTKRFAGRIHRTGTSTRRDLL